MFRIIMQIQADYQKMADSQPGRKSPVPATSAR